MPLPLARDDPHALVREWPRRVYGEADFDSGGQNASILVWKSNRRGFGITHREGEEVTASEDQSDNAALIGVNISPTVFNDDTGPERSLQVVRLGNLSLRGRLPL